MVNIRLPCWRYPSSLKLSKTFNRYVTKMLILYDQSLHDNFGFVTSKLSRVRFLLVLVGIWICMLLGIVVHNVEKFQSCYLNFKENAAFTCSLVEKKSNYRSQLLLFTFWHFKIYLDVYVFTILHLQNGRLFLCLFTVLGKTKK